MGDQDNEIVPGMIGKKNDQDLLTISCQRFFSYNFNRTQMNR